MHPEETPIRFSTGGIAEYLEKGVSAVKMYKVICYTAVKVILFRNTLICKVRKIYEFCDNMLNALK